MSTQMIYGPLAILALLVLVLYFHHRRNRSAEKAERAAMFDSCLHLFDSYRINQDGIYYPVLRGQYRDCDITLEPIADHAGFRTLPSLWLLVSVRGKVPFKGIFDFLRRPKNVEFYSPSWNLEIDMVIPEGWPRDAWFRTDNPDHMPPLEIIDPHMHIFDDIKTKELLTTPKGARIVYQANEAIRSYYMLLRQVKFEDLKLDTNLVRSLMDRVIALYEDLKREAPPHGKDQKI
ncbi:MAG: hypothetical protein LJE96_00575 [Deltaproteobacteria bacterium]|nr:hypothetical protein [Deltaproteobacteria bacterium]